MKNSLIILFWVMIYACSNKAKQPNKESESGLNTCNNFRQYKQKQWQKLKDILPDSVWQPIADSTSQSPIITYSIAKPQHLSLDSVLQALYSPANTFADSLINATKFVGWHTIAPNMLSNNNEEQPIAFSQLDLAAQFQMFENNEQALPRAECSEYAAYLGNMLKAAGISSYTYYLSDFHVMQLAYNPQQKKYYLLDAQYLRYLADEHGNFIDLASALKQIKANPTLAHKNIQWKSIATAYGSRHVVDFFGCMLQCATWNFGKPTRLYEIKGKIVAVDAYHADEAIPHIIYHQIEMMPPKEGYPNEEIYWLLDGKTDAPLQGP